jgi:CDP-diacylglycerol--glycerol-3-phosphate 3-phosphatidyltransferase
MPINTPILLTWLRIVAIPIFVAVYYLPDTWLSPVAKNWTAMSIFSAAAITDWLDGYLARKWGETSAFGAFLDPVADKLMVCSALLVLLKLQRVDAFVALVIIGREITISALREWMAQIGASRSVAVHMVGKVKTVVQMIAIPFLLYHGTLFRFIDTQAWGTVLIVVSAVLTIWSMVYYLQKALPEIRARVR